MSDYKWRTIAVTLTVAFILFGIWRWALVGMSEQVGVAWSVTGIFLYSLSLRLGGEDKS